MKIKFLYMVIFNIEFSRFFWGKFGGYFFPQIDALPYDPFSHCVSVFGNSTNASFEDFPLLIFLGRSDSHNS